MAAHMFSTTAAYQVVQGSHEGLELVLPDAALGQRSEGGAGPAHGAGCVGFVGGSVQHYQVVFTTGTAQSRHLGKEKRKELI